MRVPCRATILSSVDAGWLFPGGSEGDLFHGQSPTPTSVTSGGDFSRHGALCPASGTPDFLCAREDAAADLTSNLHHGSTPKPGSHDTTESARETRRSPSVRPMSRLLGIQCTGTCPPLVIPYTIDPADQTAWYPNAQGFHLAYECRQSQALVATGRSRPTWEAQAGRDLPGGRAGVALTERRLPPPAPLAR